LALLGLQKVPLNSLKTLLETRKIKNKHFFSYNKIEIVLKQQQQQQFAVLSH
jgi:hypothetical protein